MPSAISGTSSANSLRTRLGWVRRQRDLRAAQALRDADDVAARSGRRARSSRPAPARPAAARPRSCRGRPRRSPRALARASRWMTPRDDVALAAGELAEGVLVLGVAQPLQDDLPRGRGRDPAEALRGVVPLAGDRAVRRRSPGPARATTPVLRSMLDARVRLVALGVAVGGEQRGLDRLQDGVERDLLVALDGAQRGDVDVHAGSSAVVSASSATSVSGAGLNSTSTAARSTSA